MQLATVLVASYKNVIFVESRGAMPIPVVVYKVNTS